ncbi:hypothetical protein ID866_6511 [Astraeus odoratus]|nr:hypothetical protein ID866_6511 [Astraeus odoratus]
MTSGLPMKHSKISSLLSIPRVASLLGSILVALCSGTNYVFSAYAPQLRDRLHISNTQLNIVGLAGHVGYAGTKRLYDVGTGDAATIPPTYFVLLVVCALFIGFGANAGLASGVNTTAKSFPESLHATTTGMVVAGMGLSAFCFSTIANMLFPGDTSALLLVLALGTSIPVLAALLVVRPVPPGSPHLKADEDESGQNEEAQASMSEPDSRTPLLGNRHASRPSLTGETGQEQEYSGIQADSSLDDVHGSQLFRSPNFYMIMVIVSLLCGTGIMYINNVGSISLALYAQSNPDYDRVEAAKWQAKQVSTLSIGNFSGRLVIGLISDFIRTRLLLPRTYSLCLVSSVFIVSLAIAISISSVDTLWIASAVLGLAYGNLWGGLPAIIIDWFGLGGNLFSVMFGAILDAHAPKASLYLYTYARRAATAVHELVQGGASAERQCLAGRECYVLSLQITLGACIVALALSTWAGIRDGRRIRGRAIVGGE